MNLDDIEVRAKYSKQFGSNTLRVNLWQRPGEEAHLQILTTGQGSSGDAIVEIGLVDDLSACLKETKTDFQQRFQFTNHNLGGQNSE